MEVYKITLSTKKVVYLRPFKMKDQETAIKIAGPKSGDNNHLFGLYMQQELVKNLLVQVDEKQLSASDREDLDSLFTPKEYQQVSKIVMEISGFLDQMKEPAMPELEMLRNFGDKSQG